MTSSSLLLPPIGSVYSRCSSTNCHPLHAKVRGAMVQCSSSQQRLRAPEFQCNDGTSLVKRRNVFGVVIGVSGIFFLHLKLKELPCPKRKSQEFVMMLVRKSLKMYGEITNTPVTSRISVLNTWELGGEEKNFNK